MAGRPNPPEPSPAGEKARAYRMRTRESPPGDVSTIWGMPGGESKVTRLLRDPRLEAEGGAEELFRAVEAELRALAKARMARERPGHTLQATILVNDVFIRLVRDHRGAFENRRHFYAAAAEAMRRILIDHARARNALKRGGGAAADAGGVPEPAGTTGAIDVLEISEELDALAHVHERAAQVVKLRVFAGLTHAQVANLLDVPISLVSLPSNT